MDDEHNILDSWLRIKSFAAHYPRLMSLLCGQMAVSTVAFIVFTIYNTRNQRQRQKPVNARRTKDTPVRLKEMPKIPFIDELLRMESTDIDPFHNHTQYLTLRERVKMSLLAGTLAPLRACLLLTSLIGLATFCWVITLGADMSPTTPLSWWRQRALRMGSKLAARLMLFAFGVNWVSVSGSPCPQTEAQLIVSNHLSFVEPVVLGYLCFCTGIAKAELRSVPFLGRIIRAFMTLFVDRSSHTSRHDTVEALRARFKPHSGFPKMLIFPEGTRTNGDCVVTFKPGAFVTGAAVQPVAVRFPYTHCDPTRVKDGPGTPFLTFKLMCQFYNSVHVTFLPVHKPTKEEIENPLMFATAVQVKIAKALDVPVTTHSFADTQLQITARKNGLPARTGVVNLLAVQKLVDVSIEEAKCLLKEFALNDDSKQGQLALGGFVRVMKLPNNIYTARLYELLKHKSSHYGVSFRNILVAWAIVNGREKGQSHNQLRLAFHVLDVHFNRKVPLSKNAAKNLFSRVNPKLSDSELSWLVEAFVGASEQAFVDFGVKNANLLPDLCEHIFTGESISS